MARLDVNRSGEMEVFVRVVDLGGFSAAARHFAMTPSAVSKLVSRLEARLNARLVNRSTRKLQLTPEGCRYYERGVRVLANLDEAEGAAALADSPSGRVRVSCNIPFGRHVLLPVLADFMGLYPDVSLDLSLTDSVVDLLEDRADVAVRAGPLKNSTLMARKLGTVKMHIAAAPGYSSAGAAAPSGGPAESQSSRTQLCPHNWRWPFLEGGVNLTIKPAGSIRRATGRRYASLLWPGQGWRGSRTFRCGGILPGEH